MIIQLVLGVVLIFSGIRTYAIEEELVRRGYHSGIYWNRVYSRLVPGIILSSIGFGIFLTSIILEIIEERKKLTNYAKSNRF